MSDDLKKSNLVYKVDPSIRIEDFMGPPKPSDEMTKEEKNQFAKYKKLMKNKREGKPLTESEKTFIQNFFKQNLSNGGKVYSNTLRKAKY
jgi:hypothetical protein